MKKILIDMKDNTIIFSYKTGNSIKEDLINTNIISDNELVFSDLYIKENNKILSSFIKELAIQYQINTCIITKKELAPIVLDLLKKATNILNICFSDDDGLTYSIIEQIVNLKHIKHISCYSIQPFMIEMLDNNNITCESRSEILYISNFMEQNNLLRYSNIYYKTNVRMNLPLLEDDYLDFEDFCKINKYLKTIHLNKLDLLELDKIVSILNKNHRKNIKVVIHENLTDEKIAEKLKKLNKTYKSKYQIVLSLEYSKDYLDKNIFKQTITNTLKVCGLIISSLVVLVITYIGVSNYIAFKEVNKIKDDLAKVIEEVDTDSIIDKKQEEDKNKAEENNIPIDSIKLISNEKLAALLSVNEDVIGELKINNINIDYPVLQTVDNDYYLDHDINKKKSVSGWLFMDYRADAMNLSKNNIIYGHNVYYGGIMFGTLYKAANKSWYTNPENQLITYNTLYENMQFRIFSIYRVPKTTDYLRVNFRDDNDFLDFIKMIKARSYYDFGVKIDASDKILTLSTCSDNGSKRLVVHAVLVKNTKN